MTFSTIERHLQESTNPLSTNIMPNSKIIPNPHSQILSKACVGGVGLCIPKPETPPDGFAAVVLYIPIESINGKTAVDIQKDLGLPWYCDGNDPVWLEDELCS